MHKFTIIIFLILNLIIKKIISRYTQQKIVITGGPGTGKSTIINELLKMNHACMPEISRQITLDAQKKGTVQLFLKKPLLFSELLLDGRVNQFLEANKKKNNIVFLIEAFQMFMAI